MQADMMVARAAELLESMPQAWLDYDFENTSTLDNTAFVRLRHAGIVETRWRCECTCPQSSLSVHFEFLTTGLDQFTKQNLIFEAAKEAPEWANSDQKTTTRLKVIFYPIAHRLTPRGHAGLAEYVAGDHYEQALIEEQIRLAQATGTFTVEKAWKIAQTTEKKPESDVTEVVVRTGAWISAATGDGINQNQLRMWAQRSDKAVTGPKSGKANTYKLSSVKANWPDYAQKIDAKLSREA